jgi:phospholipid transport system transporter-binding protein
VSEAEFRVVGEGRYQVTGRMTFQTAGSLWEQSKRELNGQGVLTIDFGEVTQVDSAGLSLLLEWISSARQQGLTLRFTQLPAKLLALARISEVENLLGIDAGPSQTQGGDRFIFREEK